MCPPDEDHRAALGRPRRGRRARPAPGDASRARRAGPRAARADLPDPALRRHLAQPAARRPSRGATRTRASCASGSRRSGTGRRSTSRGPRPGSTCSSSRKVDLYLREGFLKEKPLLGQLEPDVFPFLFSPRVQRAVFEQCVADVAARDRARTCSTATSPRTSTPGSTTRTCTTAPKRAVTAFTPRLAMEAERLERYLAAYPDGTFVSIVRDPRAWYASASRHRARYEDVERRSRSGGVGGVGARRPRAPRRARARPHLRAARR